MGETRASRVQLTVIAGAGYGLVFASLCVFHVPPIAIAAYFVIPTALLAIAGGPVAGACGSVVAMLLFLAGGIVNPSASATTTASLVTSGRMIALLSTGVLIGWFAMRNRALLAELRRGAEHDHLTGLGNYRFYEAAVERRLESGETFVLLVCDMDRLKDVNDARGHSAGDDALRTLAETLRSLARADDEIARIGGDEFCVVATVRGPEDAGAIALRFEERLFAEGCAATFGWAVAPNEGSTKNGLFKQADERLYARKAPRDRVLHAVS